MFALAVDLLRSRKTMVLAICAGLLFTSIGYLALYPSFEDQIQSLADDLPDAYKAFIGDADIGSPEGYIRSQVYSLVAPLLIAGAAIAAGSSLARAERDQTLVVFVVTPLSRRALAGAWLLFLVTGVVIAAVASIVGVVVGGPLAGAEVGLDRVLLATLPMLMFGLLVGCVALLVSTLTGAPSTATGLGWMTVLISFLANSLGELIDSLHWLSLINPWTWHGAGEAITGDFNLGNFVLLALSSAVIASAAIISFTRRNLHL